MTKSRQWNPHHTPRWAEGDQPMLFNLALLKLGNRNHCSLSFDVTMAFFFPKTPVDRKIA